MHSYVIGWAVTHPTPQRTEAGSLRNMHVRNPFSLLKSTVDGSPLSPLSGTESQEIQQLVSACKHA